MLYKFRNAINFNDLYLCRTSRIVEKKSLWFSNPHYFNDPYEFKFQWDKSNRGFGGSINNISSFSSRCKSLMDLSASFEASRNGIDKKIIDMAFLHTGALQILGVIDKAEEYVQWVINNNVAPILHSLCLFRYCDDILLWSHYASNHEGIALGFSDGIYSDLERSRINYQSEYKKIGYLEVDLFNLSKELIFRKSIEWKRENEVRIVAFPSPSRTGSWTEGVLRLEVNDFWAYSKEYFEKYPNRKLPSEKDALEIEMNYWRVQHDAIEKVHFSKNKKLNSLKGSEISFRSESLLKEVVFGAKLNDDSCRMHMNYIRNLGYSPLFKKCRLSNSSYSLELDELI